MAKEEGWYKNGVKSPDPVPCKHCGRKPQVCGQVLYCENRACHGNEPWRSQRYEDWQVRNTKNKR